MQGKQATMVSPTQERAILGYLATTRYPARGSCPSSVRVNTRGLPGDRHRIKKAWTSGSSWPPSGPLSPRDALDAGRVDARRLLRSPL